MKFVSIRDFRTHTAQVRKDLDDQREIVLTANGKPIAVLAHVDEESLEDVLKALRRSRAHALVDRIQSKAKERGVDKLTMEQIDEIIAESRREGRGE